MGIALLLVGIGFLVLVLGGIERKPATATAQKLRHGPDLIGDSARRTEGGLRAALLRWGKSRRPNQ